MYTLAFDSAHGSLEETLLQEHSVTPEEAEGLDVEWLYHVASVDELVQVRARNQERIRAFNEFKRATEAAMQLTPEQTEALVQQQQRERDDAGSNHEARSALTRAQLQAEQLNAFVVREDGCNTWPTWKLLRVLSTFESLGADQYLVDLYHTSYNTNFRSIPRARESYASALTRLGRVADAIHELTEMRLELPKEAHRMTSLLLGDCYRKQAAVADEAVHFLEAVEAGDLTNMADGAATLQRYRNHFQSRSQLLLPLSLSAVRANAINARRLARTEYLRQSALECHFEPILRILDVKRTEMESVSQQIRKLEQQLRELQLHRSVIATELSSYGTMARFCSRKLGGEESKDYWVHAAALEAACYQDSATRAELFYLCDTLLGSITPTMFNPSRLLETARRLESIERWLLGVADASRNSELGTRAKSLRSVIERIHHAYEQLQSGTSRGTAAAAAAFSRPYAKRVLYSAAGEEFLKHTFNMRGLIASNRPHFIPGGMSVVGSRVPDMIFSNADKPIFMRLLREWGLLELEDAREFVRRLVGKVRQCFGTKRLQDLHSELHEAFDLASEGATELVGITPEMRRGMDCSTNCATALMLLGDCREHTIEMLAFYDFWQSELLNRSLRPSLRGSGDTDLTSTRASIGDFSEEHFDTVLRKQLRGAHVGVLAPVRMDSKYNPTGYKREGFVPYVRHYSLEAWRAGERLSLYELQNSLLLARYNDGSTRAIEPYWNATTSYWGMDNTDGVPVVPDAERCVELELWNTIEEHTMTFFVEEDASCADESFLTMTSLDSGALEQLHTLELKVERADAFYNELHDRDTFPSPYAFGSGRVDLNELLTLGTLDGGSMKAAEVDDIPARLDEQTGVELEPARVVVKRIVDVPVRLKLLAFSQRSDAPALGDDDSSLRLIGMNLTNVDVAAELVRESMQESRSLPTRREHLLKNLEQLALYCREERKQQEEEKKRQQAAPSS